MRFAKEELQEICELITQLSGDQTDNWDCIP